MIKAQRTKPPTPTRAIDALIGEEEQNGKEKQENGPNLATMDNLVVSYVPHQSYGSSITAYMDAAIKVGMERMRGRFMEEESP